MDKWTSSLQETKPMQPSPKLLNMEPTFGYEGTIITLVLQELLPCQTVKLAFNSLVVETRQLQSQGTTSLVAHVPNFQTTLSTSSMVPISICYIEKDMIQDTIFIANFTYQSHPHPNIPSSVSSSPSSNSFTTIHSHSNHPHPNNNNNNNNNNDDSFQRGRKRSIISFMNDMPMSNNKRFYQGITQDSFTNYLPSNNAYHSMPLSSYPYYQQKDNSSSPLTSPSLPPPSYTPPSFPTTSISTSSSSTTTTSTSTSSSATTASSSISQQQQQQSNKKIYHRPTVHSLKSTSHQPSTSVANYQPYPGLVSQNNLELATDLDTMMQNWTSEECQQGRRLVRFWRQDSSSSLKKRNQPLHVDNKNNKNDIDDDVIRCFCESISQQDPAATDSSNTVVSCIYCPDRNDYFITSVDCIYLLESLMNTHFGVEEKNRIRRNLEGFRPITVAKCKPKSADFFKLVMGFPHPKPRNIEKDIKAFTWKILPYALKKIIMKYTVTSSLSCNNNHNTNNSNRSMVTTLSSNNNNTSSSSSPPPYSTYESSTSSSSTPFTLPPCTLSTSSSTTTTTSISSILSSNHHPSSHYSTTSPMMSDELHSISSSTDQSPNYYPYSNNTNNTNNTNNNPMNQPIQTSSPSLSVSSPQLTYVSSSPSSTHPLQYMDPIISTPTTTSFPIHSMPTTTSSSMMLPPPTLTNSTNFMSQLTTENISPYDSSLLTYSS